MPPDPMRSRRAARIRLPGLRALLKALANEDRLLLLCQLVGHERNVGELEALTGIRQHPVATAGRAA